MLRHKEDERRTYPDSRSNLVRGKLISVSDEPVFTKTEAYRVEIEPRLTNTEFYFIDDNELKRFNTK